MIAAVQTPEDETVHGPLLPVSPMPSRATGSVLPLGSLEYITSVVPGKTFQTLESVTDSMHAPLVRVRQPTHGVPFPSTASGPTAETENCRGSSTVVCAVKSRMPSAPKRWSEKYTLPGAAASRSGSTPSAGSGSGVNDGDGVAF